MNFNYYIGLEWKFVFSRQQWNFMVYRMAAGDRDVRVLVVGKSFKIQNGQQTTTTNKII